jgi:hypothetical protein
LFTVRLACVRHAASVHPEPGSNSHVKMISKPLPRFRRSKALCPFLADQTLTVISYLSSGYTLKCIVLYFSEFLSTLPRPALDSCVSCSCGWSWNLQGCISVRLSNRFHLKYFIQMCICRADAKRRKRDLNPRAAINDLLPFQGSPFDHLGISPMCPILNGYMI